MSDEVQELEEHQPGVSRGDGSGSGHYKLEPLPLWIHRRIQAGDTGTGEILHLADDGRYYETVVEGKNSELETMLDYLEAGERFLHGTRTYQANQA